MAQLLASKPTARPAPLAGPAPRLGVAARFAAPAAPAAARRLAARGGVQEITTEEDYMRFIAGPELTLVDFYTSWCGPCKMMARTVSMMAEEAEYAGAVTFGKCNLQSMPAAFARQHGIRDLPTIQAFRSGTVVGQIKRVDPNGLRKMVGEQMRAKAKA